MPSPREVKRRMNSVKNMSQITRAMEMVAASKMRRAQDRVTAGRPYADRLRDVLGDLASLHLDDEEMKEFPLLEQREVQRSALIVMSPVTAGKFSVSASACRTFARSVELARLMASATIIIAS